MRIIFLGEQFSYHHLAAMAFYGKENDFTSSLNFETIIDKVVSGEVDHGIIAVENSLAGDVPGNFQLLCNSPVEICGEISLTIELQLAAIPGVRIHQIETIYSHKMAIRETTKFFSRYPSINFVETPSTSSAVKLVAALNSIQAAAIGSLTAIQFYKLETLASDIANSTDNRTRFLMLSHKSRLPLTTNFAGKASLLLRSDEMAYLNNVVSDMLDKKEISFLRSYEGGNVYIEMGLTNNFQFDNTLREMKEKGIVVRVLGVYNVGDIVKGF